MNTRRLAYAGKASTISLLHDTPMDHAQGLHQSTNLPEQNHRKDSLSKSHSVASQNQENHPASTQTAERRIFDQIVARLLHKPAFRPFR